ncbi:MAG TPA: hypothetical protein VK425_00815 [Acidimicrobiales bacterium]|nr:hypothetical protein [Acidimicrobiales bacterium]
MLAFGLGVAIVPGVPASASPKAPNVKPWLLKPSDLAGWTQESPSPPASGCLALRAPLADQRPGSSGTVQFKAGSQLLAEMVASWPSHAAAVRAWTAVSSGARGCNSYTTETATGRPVPVTVKRVNLGHYGSLSASYQATYKLFGFPFDTDETLVCKGRAVVLVEYSGVAPVPLSDVQPVLAIAVAKVRG